MKQSKQQLNNDIAMQLKMNGGMFNNHNIVGANLILGISVLQLYLVLHTLYSVIYFVAVIYRTCPGVHVLNVIKYQPNFKILFK